jgi:hypothetical protein
VKPAPVGGSWPLPRQVLLLRAALLSGEAALSAWSRWREAADLDAIDSGSYRLLPLLWHNLAAHGVTDPILDRCRGIFRHTWSKNQLLLHRVAPVLRELTEAGIGILVLKGGAMATLYYPTLGTRPMNDLDVLVPAGAAAAARQLLADRGWTPTLDLPPSYLPFLHALGYRNAAGSEIDLHWRAFWEGARAERDDTLWHASRPVRLAGIDLSTLAPTDHLFQVVVHGLRWSDVPPIHWVADATRILSVDGPAVNWERLIAHAERGRLTRQLAAALAFLRRALDLDVPEEVVERLRAHPSGAAERLEMWARMRPPSLAGGALLHWCDYRRRLGEANLPQRMMGFPNYLRTVWGVERLRHLPGSLVAKTFYRLRVRLGGSARRPAL